MKTKIQNKKVWMKPAIHSLSIRKDTFGGSINGPEGGGKKGPPVK